MAESKEKLNSFLMTVKGESERFGLKLNIEKTKIMTSDRITSWQIEGGKVEAVTDFILGAPKSLQMITAATKLKDTCSLEKCYDKSWLHIKKQRHLLCWQRSVESKLCFFQVVMYVYDSWSIKKAEHQRIDAFELWCWRRLLRVPWTSRRSNQSILKEINPEYPLEGLMIMLKLQNFGHLM